MKKRRRAPRHVEDNENFWPAFTDMIVTVFLVLFFLVLVFYLKKIADGNAITSMSARLDEIGIELEEKEGNLTASRVEVAEIQLEKQLLIAERDALQEEKSLIEAYVGEQEQIIVDSNEELENLRAKLRGVALLRVDVLEKVKKSIENELGEFNDTGNPVVSIGDNGNIIINESLVFDTNSSEIKSNGQDLLDNLAVAFENVLKDEDIRENIDAIAIQGHTDARSSHDYNRVLSAERAYNVVNYLLEANTSLATEYGQYFTASAYSEFRLIDSGTSDQAHAKNRRIEIAVILKDSHIQNVINAYLNESLKDFE